MKLHTMARSLSDALSAIEKAIPKSNYLPAVSCALLEADGDQLTLAGTDLHHRGWRSVGAKVDEPGAVLVPPKALADFLAAVPANEGVLIEVDEQHKTTLTCGRTVVRVAGLDREQFPAAPSFDDPAFDLTLSASVLARLVASVEHAVAPDEDRPVLAGIHVKLADGVLTLVAADGYRLSIRSETVAQPGELPDLSLIVHGARLAEVGRALEKATSARLIVDGKHSQVLIESEVGSWAVALIDGQYPDWNRIIPSRERITATVTVARPDMLRAARLIRGLTEDTTDRHGKTIRGAIRAVLSTTESTLTVRASDTTRDQEATVTIDAERGGKDVEITFNGRYLRDALDALEGDRLTLELTGRESPSIAREAGERNGHLQILMPMHVAR